VLRAGRSVVRFPEGVRDLLSSSECPHCLWAPSSFLLNGHHRFFPRGAKRPAREVNHLPQFSAFILDSLTVEDGTDRLSRNVGTELPLNTAHCPRRDQVSSTSRRKPGVTHVWNLINVFIPFCTFSELFLYDYIGAYIVMDKFMYFLSRRLASVHVDCDSFHELSLLYWWRCKSVGAAVRS
jgi:hypothetical protein